MKKIELNLNDYILFRPTQKGLERIVEMQNRVLPAELKTTFAAEAEKVDKAGYLRLQIHQFMWYFGGTIDLPAFVDLDVIFEEANVRGA